MEPIAQDIQLAEMKEKNLSRINAYHARILFLLGVFVTLFASLVYVIESNHPMVVFAVGSYICYATYFAVHHYLVLWSSSYQCLENEKQFYVLSNLIKCGALILLTPFACRTLWNICLYDHWDNVIIRNQAMLYAITDVMSLCLVSRMSCSTKLHHVVVAIFAFLSLFNDYTTSNFCRGVVVYAIFSVYSYLVNGLLALRFLAYRPRGFTTVALCIYLISCALNWSWQIYFILNQMKTVALLTYILLTFVLVHDDVVLMKWLWNKRTH